MMVFSFNNFSFNFSWLNPLLSSDDQMMVDIYAEILKQDTYLRYSSVFFMKQGWVAISWEIETQVKTHLSGQNLYLKGRERTSG